MYKQINILIQLFLLFQLKTSQIIKLYCWDELKKKDTMNLWHTRCQEINKHQLAEMQHAETKYEQ